MNSLSPPAGRDGVALLGAIAEGLRYVRHHAVAQAVYLADRVLVMSGRPSTIRDIVTIDLPRPRPIDLLNSDALGHHVSHMRRLFAS